ncbi:hypothetical protein [Streptomyces sp. NPDC056132]|uniref:hypothetical protein n=1 Tax=Streptomyces sp. NPDC056132 TaxID=3345722 RepID=UPI0035DEC1C8
MAEVRVRGRSVEEVGATVAVCSVEEVGATAVVCVVRCVAGVVRVGQVFAVVEPAVRARRVGRGGRIELDGLERYGRAVDFVDPSHAARARLTGPGIGLPAAGVIMVAVAQGAGGEGSAPHGCVPNA